ncbi:hypothetical protein ABZY02_33275 [Streptomyces sp. NPDC006649]|uniref:hypothetical protein n=1 Tax=Streptomyces sp. NPDC006649 TaxID=3156896 RepID=UPI0033BB06DE
MITPSNLAGQALRRIRAQQARIELAKAVQHSMLPALPDHLPGLEIAARYRGSCIGLDVAKTGTTRSRHLTVRWPW